MAHKQIPEIAAAEELDGTEQFHIVQGSNSRRLTLQELADFAFGQLQQRESFIIPCSDETSALVATEGVFTFTMPYAFLPTAIKADVVTAPAGSAITVDVKVGGVSILSTLITIDAGETSSATAAVPAVLLSNTIPSNGIVSVDIDAVGSGTAGAGLKVTLIGRQDNS